MERLIESFKNSLRDGVHQNPIRPQPDHSDARSQVVQNICEMVEKKTIFWDDSEHLSDWIEKMMLPGTHGDSFSLQVASNLLGRDIIIIPSRKESAHNPFGYILIESCISNCNPMYMMYFEEYVYGTRHYQSIRRVNLMASLRFISI